MRQVLFEVATLALDLKGSAPNRVKASQFVPDTTLRELNFSIQLVCRYLYPAGLQAHPKSKVKT